MIGEYTVYFKPGIAESDKTIIEQYWKFDNGEFINKPSEFRISKNLSQGDLNKLIRNFSEFEADFGTCEKCESVIRKSFYTQSSVKDFIIHNYRRCDKCRPEYIQEMREEMRQKGINIGLPVYISRKFFVEGSTARSTSPPQKGVAFKFSLLTNKFPQTKESQPEYSGTFKPKEDFILQKGIVYAYGGWVNDDGSIYLKIQPKSDLPFLRENSKESEPKKIGTIIDEIVHLKNQPD